MKETIDRPMSKGLVASAWLIYAAIVFEILFMVSPFALYYYSIYSVPLNWLQEGAHTAWLPLYILPHFAYTECLLSNLLILLSWPLILVGLVVFFLGFLQIYWAKLTGKSLVDVGFYRHIRHPQYLALAVVGLGTTIFWSRFIVLVAYVTMLFLYWFLARHEERRCLQKFGEPYRDYQAKTGMFLPVSWTRWLPRVRPPLPASHLSRFAVLLILYLSIVGLAVMGGFGLKRHVLARITTLYENDIALIALAPMQQDTMREIHALLDHDPRYLEAREQLGAPQAIGYVAPSSWSVPELGLLPGGRYRHSGVEELLHPTIHGNSLEFDPSDVTVLVTEPIVVDDAARGAGLLLTTLAYTPRIRARLDLNAGRVVSLSPEPDESAWKGIPVPVY